MRTLGGMIALLLALTACTGGEGGASKNETDAPKATETPKPAAPTRDNTPATLAWTADLSPIGQPIVSGATAIVIAKASGKRLQIVGVDTATGEKRWSHPFSPNRAVPGIGLAPQTAKTSDGEERVVFFLAPDKPTDDPDDLLTPIVAVDPATGDIEQKSETIEAPEPVGACDGGIDVCVKGAAIGARTYSNLRFDLDTGTFKSSTTGAPKNARVIGSAGLFSTDDRPGEKLGVRRDGKTLWTASTEKLFGKGYTSDNGWVFPHETEPDRYTGLIGQPNDTVDTETKAGGPFIYDLAKQKIISFSGADGTVLWARDGADMCFAPTDFDDEEELTVIEHPVRCLVAGTYTSDDDKITTQGVTMTVEGYDPGTGATTWSHPMPDAAAATYWQGAPRPLVRGGETIVAPLDAGPSLIDATTGATTVVKDDIFLCQAPAVDFDYVTAWLYGERKVYDRRGTGLVTTCTADGTTVDTVPTVAAVREGAIDVDDSTYVLSTKEGLVGYTAG